MADDRLSLVVEHANGTTSRWAGDEVNAGNITQGLRFGTALPGGFTSLETELLRNLNPRSDEALFDTVKCIGAGGVVAWEGRMERLPRSNLALAPAAVGWAAHLKDDASFREIYRDHDLSRWRGPGTTRTVALDTAQYGIAASGGVEVLPDTATPALRLKTNDTWVGAHSAIAEAWYDAQGVPIGSLVYGWTRGANVSSGGDPYWSWQAALSTDDALSASDATADLQAAGPGSGTLTATAGTRKYAMVNLYYGDHVGSAGTVGTDYSLFWTTLAVYGRHGLTLQADGGLLASDMIADIIRRAAPLLGTSGIVPTGFSIPQAAFLDPVNAETAVSTVNAYHAYEWGCWEDREFFFRPTDPDRTVWNVRLSEGATLSLEGDNASEVLNGVVVKYQLADGTRRSAGPSTASNVDVTSALLEDTSSSNPANAHGLRRWDILELSVPTTDAGATQIGAVYLAEKLIADRAGSVTITGSVEKRGAGRYPAWAVRAGDYLTIADRAGEPIRRIVSTSYEHGSRTITCEVGNRVNKLDALLVRLDAQIAGVV